jgi:DNA polymerase I-like protein with 3'-5' exonuclease and polymerase domains/uracil-DNA glycosylase
MMQVRPSGPAPAKIMIVGEFPGEMEVARGEPFVGYSGQELGKMLAEAGIPRSTCFLTNFIRIRPPANDIGAFIAARKSDVTPQHGLIRDKMCLPPVWEGLELLKREIEMVRPNVIIALGNATLWALTGKWGITSWRGSMLQTDLDLALDYAPKVLPTYAPAMVMRQWSWRPICVRDFRRAQEMSQTRELIRPDYRFVVRPDFPLAASIIDQLWSRIQQGPLRLSIDIETRAGHIACIGIGWSKLDAICIPLLCTERLSGYWTEAEESSLMFALYKLFTHPNCQGIGQNFSYDAQYFLRHLLYSPRLLRDTMLAQHSCFSNLPKGLDFLSSMYCEFHEYWKDEGKEWDQYTGEDQLWTYNCKDCVITFEVEEILVRNVQAMRLESVEAFQQSLFVPVLKTMTRGIRVDQARRNRFAMELFEEIAKRETWLQSVTGGEFNIKSPKQMKEFFYDQLRLKPVVDRKTGQPTCNDEALGRFAEREVLLRPFVRRIQELRSLGVFLSTFVNAPLDIDGRLRCSYNIAGTETFRFNSSKNAFGSGLNLQNIPKGGETGDGELELPNVRSLFIPDPGCTFFDIDLNSADLRIVVWEADEPEMKAILREGKDPYTEIAKEFYHDPTITKKDPRRQTFKSFAHGTNYLGTAKGLAERLGLSVKDAESTQRWYFGKFPKIKKWQDDLKDQVIKRRYVQNIFGNRMYFWDRIEGTIFNQAAAWIPQSTVGCLINRGYVAIHNQRPEVEILLQVHDSLAGQFPTSQAEFLTKEVIRLAEVPLPYADPLVIPVGCKTSTESWGACG